MPAERDWIAVLSQPLDFAAAVAHVRDALAGGIDVFLGTTRQEHDEGGRQLVALDYEAYHEMALKQMQDLSRRARARWPIVRLALLHRVGRVALGEPSVIIAVATPHRADAFEACRFLIDELKKDVAIWKKEVWADGSMTWVHPGGAAEGQQR
ncbi:molybdenum cofactor biosynthesis protein MoaE [Fontivita pretiosa]|uniref:molybdenum cofactor biosynthesis protein MoaE n=1 Tax=Fontivita pretiosa TaxID=2989684 RepID=UPI003D165DD1